MRLIPIIPKQISHLLVVITTALLVIIIGSRFGNNSALIHSLDQHTIDPKDKSSLTENHPITNEQRNSLEIRKTPSRNSSTILPSLPAPHAPPVSASLPTPPMSASSALEPHMNASNKQQLYPPQIPVLPIIVDNSPNKIQVKYGHFPYDEAAQVQLVEVGDFVRDNYSRSERLRIEAAESFQLMRDSARLESILMMPISGFRSVSDQRDLFIQQTQRKGGEAEASRYSAPAGYSEHHTGYAVDIADERHPDTDLKVAFEETEVYRWLLVNAIRFGFEQSFPLNNRHGVSYEPWHWRFVGSQQSQVVFSAARGPVHGTPLVIDTH